MKNVKKEVNSGVVGSKQVSLDKPAKTINNPIVDVPEKDLLKRSLIAFLNRFEYKTDWDIKHENLFMAVLDGGYISAQNTELASLGSFLERKNITMIKPDGKDFNFAECFKWSDIMQDAKLVEKEKITFPASRIKFHKKFLANYGLVFASIAKGVKDYGHVNGVTGKEGMQILSFISLLVKLNYKFK